MNLLEVYKKIKKPFGFTLMEIILVIALMFAVGLFVAPIGVSFYHSQLINETADGLVSALRQAQSFSLTGKGDHAFGVSVQNDQYVIFTGETYAARVPGEDTIFPIVSAVSVTGPSEVVFSRLTGLPNETGTFFVTLGSKEKQIEMLQSGNIDR